MSKVEEIEKAIEQLPPKDFAKLSKWFVQRQQDEWDQQMAGDAVAGKLDFLVKEAKASRKAGTLKDWPGHNS